MGEEKFVPYVKLLTSLEEGRSLKEVANDLADVLLEDLSRALPGEYKTITALAPAERREVWKNLDILPISAYNEAFECIPSYMRRYRWRLGKQHETILALWSCFHIHWRSGSGHRYRCTCSDKAVAAHPKLTSVP